MFLGTLSAARTRVPVRTRNCACTLTIRPVSISSGGHVLTHVIKDQWLSLLDGIQISTFDSGNGGCAFLHRGCFILTQYQLCCAPVEGPHLNTHSSHRVDAPI